MANKRDREMKKLKTDRSFLLTENDDFPVQEAYKALRTSISFALTTKDTCHTILVTSAKQNEGKTITAANIAIAYAEAERRVLLIEADLRTPTISRLLNIDVRFGLSNLITDALPFDQVIKESDVQNLDVICSGDIPTKPSELLLSDQLKDSLQQLRQHYDYIVIDSPALTSVTDAILLVPHCEGIIMATRSGFSDRGSISYALNQLNLTRANVLGFVLNGMSSAKNQRYYHEWVDNTRE